MSFYEATFVMRQDVSSQDVGDITDKLVENLESNGGKLIKKEYWGLRRLAYNVRKNYKGHYVLLGIEADNNALNEWERICKTNESIIKHMYIKVDEVDVEPSIIMREVVEERSKASAENVSASSSSSR
jgi:small subunit ribosomal protein S6